MLGRDERSLLRPLQQGPTPFGERASFGTDVLQGVAPRGKGSQAGLVSLGLSRPRRTTQPVQNVDKSWPTSGLGVDVLTYGRTIGRVYLAPGGEPLDFEEVDGYTRIALPPVAVHAVIILE